MQLSLPKPVYLPESLPMPEGITLSAVFHLLIILLFLYGLPQFGLRMAEEIRAPVPFEVVSISDVPNLPTRIAQKAPSAPPPSKPRRAEAAVPPPPAPAPVAETVEEIPAEAPPAEQAAEPTANTASIAAVEAEEMAEPQFIDQFDSVLKTVERLQEEGQRTGAETAEDNQGAVNPQVFDPTKPVSATLKQAIQSALYRCWNIPAGARNAQDLSVTVVIQYNPDATVRSARVTDQGRMNRDPFFRTAAESALRAVYNPQCNPLPIPLDEYDGWQTTKMNFNPREILSP